MTSALLFAALAVAPLVSGAVSAREGPRDPSAAGAAPAPAPAAPVAAPSARALARMAVEAVASDPSARVEDLYKWLFQAARGGEHAVPSEEGARRWLDGEWASLGAPRPGEPLVVPLRPDGAVVRLNLRPWKAAGGGKDALLAAFLSSARAFRADDRLFRMAWEEAGSLLASRRHGALTDAAWLRLDAEARRAGYRAGHHSESYGAARHPAYRVLTGQEARRLVATLDGHESAATGGAGR